MKYPRSNLVILDPPLPPPPTHTPVYARALLAYTPSHPSTSAQIEDMTSTYFAKHYQSKNHKTLQNEETTVQSYQKISNQNTKRALRSSLHLLTVRGNWNALFWLS